MKLNKMVLDDKKIEEVARRNADKYRNYPTLSDEDRDKVSIGSFMDCAKWMQEEFLKNLWHSASEEPKENFDLVYINKAKEFREISSYNSDRFDDLFGEGWEAACRMFGIYKWAYKDDLLPKEGGEQ